MKNLYLICYDSGSFMRDTCYENMKANTTFICVSTVKDIEKALMSDMFPKEQIRNIEVDFENNTVTFESTGWSGDFCEREYGLIPIVSIDDFLSQ